MEQITDWLKQLGMHEYIQRFAENDIDFTILGDLTDQDSKRSASRPSDIAESSCVRLTILKAHPRLPLRLRHLPHRERRIVPSAGKSR